MKKLLFLCLPIAALLYACGEKAHKTELIYDKATEGLHIVSAQDTFNKFKGTYYVTTDIKNDTKDTVQSFLVSVNYIDAVGDIVAQSSAGAGKTLLPGASVKVENIYENVSSEKDVPYKVKLSVKDMFK